MMLIAVGAGCRGCPGVGPTTERAAGVAPADRVEAARLVDAIEAAGQQLWGAVEASEGERSIAERSGALAAWAAIVVAGAQGRAWRDRLAAPVPDGLAATVERMVAEAEGLQGGSATTIERDAVRVFDQARALALAFEVPGDPLSQGVCQRQAGAVLADLGGLATTERWLAVPRVGFPWIALSSNEIAMRIDRAQMVRPAWAHAMASPEERGGLAAPAMVDHGLATLAAADRAWRAGFEPATALALAEHTTVTGAVLVQLEARIRAQLHDVAGTTGAARDFLNATALVQGQSTGSRARASALAAGKAPEVVGMSEQRLGADASLGSAAELLASCALSLEDGPARDASVDALILLAAYRMPALGCPVGHACEGRIARGCVSDAACIAGARCVVAANEPRGSVRLCMGTGWTCQGPEDCAPGAECDRGIARCVDREVFACDSARACRAAERCVGDAVCGPRCAVRAPQPGQVCERNDDGSRLVAAQCRLGTWRQAASSTVCVARDAACRGGG